MKYEKPEMLIIVLESEHVIRTSTLISGEEGPDDSIEF